MNFFDKLREANKLRASEWGGGSQVSFNEELLYRSNELGGESGEAQDAVKKYVRFRRKMAGGVHFEQSFDDISKELADTIICCDLVAEMLGINLEKAIQHKFNKTSDKHNFETKL